MLVLFVKLATEVRERLKKIVTNQVFKSMCSRKENHVEVVILKNNFFNGGNSKELCLYHITEVRVKDIFNNDDGNS